MTRPDELPTAVARAPRGVRWIWLLPVVALAVASWIGWRAWAETGTKVVVTFGEGHGLAPGAEVRYRGIAVGQVRSVGLAPDGEAVRVRLDLGPGGERFARDGARFWIVRPQIGLETGVRGAETLLGARYVAALPGAGEERHAFRGLREPLVVADVRSEDLEIVLEAEQRGNLDVGTPLTYRDVKVGVVVDVRLSADARAVEARAHVPAEYAALVRRGTEFYFAGGVDAEWGARFLFMEFGGQLARVLSGGAVGLAVPPDPGPVVEDGHRFTIRAEVDERWAEWRPSVPIGGAGGEGAAPTVLPRPVEARLAWEEGFFHRRKEAVAWVLPLDVGLLGPLAVLRPPGDADAGSVSLVVDGQPLSPDLPPRVRGDGIGLLEVSFDGPRTSVRPWSGEGVVDLVAVRGAGEPPLVLPARHLERTDGGFAVAGDVDVTGTWNGAAVVTREGGELVGILLTGDGRTRIVRPEGNEGGAPGADGQPGGAHEVRDGGSGGR